MQHLVATHPAGMSVEPPRVALRRLCRAVAELLDRVPPQDAPRRIAALLPGILSVPGLLAPAQMAAPRAGYGRNPVYLCPRDRFSILAMVWPAGVTTPIHDHREWCAFGVYSGEIEEALYDPAGSSQGCARAALRQVSRHAAGAATHLPADAPNIHQIRNLSDGPAVSIHVYGGNAEVLGPNLDKVYTAEP